MSREQISIRTKDGACRTTEVIVHPDDAASSSLQIAFIIPETAQLHERAKKAGRDPATLSVTVFAAKPDPKMLADYAAAGMERVLFMLPSAGPDEVLAALDRLARLRG